MPITALRLVIVVSLLLASSPALAMASGVAVVVGGDADHATRQQLSAAVERSLRDRREEGQQLELNARDVDALVVCVSREMSKECASAFMRGAGAGASRVIVMRVAKNTRGKVATTITVTGWVVASDGSILVIDQGVCDACTSAKLEQASTMLLDALLREVEARTTETVLAVRTSPPGAQVEIDGRLVGISNLKHGVYPGAHRVVVQLRGHATENRTITVVAGETKTVDVTLTPTGPAPKPGRGTSRSTSPAPSTSTPTGAVRWIPWTTLGAGVLVSGAGVVLVVRDQSDPPQGYLPYERRETTILGATTIGLGAAIAGVSAWWLLRAHDDKPAPTVPAVGLGPSAVTFSLSGSF